MEVLFWVIVSIFSASILGYMVFGWVGFVVVFFVLVIIAGWINDVIHPSEEKLEREYMEYRNKIKKAQDKLNQLDKEENKAKVHKLTLELANLKIDFSEYVNFLCKGEFTNNPLQENEKLTRQEWEIYRADQLNNKVSGFWKSKEEERLEERLREKEARYAYTIKD